MKVDTCAFLPCEQADHCCLPGGCVQSRFPAAPSAVEQDSLRDDAPALNGTKAARTNRDPSQIKRKRKKLTR